MDRQMDGNIILPLRGFETVAYGRMCCAELQAAQMIAKKWCGWLDRETERQRYQETDKHIIFYTTVGINIYFSDIIGAVSV